MLPTPRRKMKLASLPSTTSRTSSELPAAVAARILGRFPQRERLTLSLVSSTWRDGAAEATVHIKCNLRPATIAPFNAWIARHGARQVQSLEAEGTECGADRLLLQLPWDKLSALESLTLDQFKLPAVSDSSSRDGSGSTNALLPRLQQLHLEYCNLHSADCLAQLVSGSSALTSLVVEGYPFADHSCGQQLRFSEPLYGLLAQQLSQLVELRLPYLSFSLPVLERLKGMQTLHDLACDVSDVVASDGWSAHLPSSLTRLRLGAGHTHEHAIPLSPQLQHLASSLRELHLLDVPVEPEQLAGMTGLNVLCLRSCMLQPAHDVTSAVGTAALLAALQQMTQLRHLQLADLNLDTETGPIGQWSALTASRQLRFLEVEYCMWDALPEGAAQHIFPPGRQLLQLHTLHLTGLGSTFEDHTWLDGADVGRLISACPRLEDLCLANALCEDADVSVLLQLPQCCSSLTIAGAAFNDAAVRVIVELTSLKELCWRDSPALSDVGLQQLSALTALTQVEVSNCGLSANVLEAAMGDPNENCVYLRDDDEGPVWHQLQQICERSLQCAAAARTQLQATINTLQQQLADKEAQLAQSQARVQELEQLTGGGATQKP